MAVLYDPSVGYLRTLLRLTHTAVPSVLRRFEYWLLLAVHVCVGCAYQRGYISAERAVRLKAEDSKIIAALTSFFLVFYTKHCYERYQMLHSLMREMLGKMYDYSTLLRIYLKDDHQQHIRLAIRQLAATTLYFLLDLNAQGLQEEGVEHLRRVLVSSQERELLDGLDARMCSMVMLQLSGEAMASGHQLSGGSAISLVALTDTLLSCRGLQQEVIDTVRLPVPYQYYHLLKTMLFINLSAWAWDMALTQSVFTPAVYFIVQLTFMSMMELAAQLADPFGTDEVDFPVMEWFYEFMEKTGGNVENAASPHFFQEALKRQQPLEVNRQCLQFSSKDYSDTSASATNEEDSEEEDCGCPSLGF